MKQKKQENEAAVKIQKTFRGSKQRKRYEMEKKTKNAAATKIQASFRGSHLRKRQVVTYDVKELYESIQNATREGSEVIFLSGKLTTQGNLRLK